MLFACEYCYGTEIVLAGLASSGVFVSWIYCTFRRMFSKKKECTCEHCEVKGIDNG